MAHDINRKHIIIVADDMGISSSVNIAVAEAHNKGIVTSASLMAGGKAFEEAVKISLNYRSLSVGLHVALCDGKSVLKHSQIPDLVDQDRHFEKHPAKAWMRYMRTGILPQIEAEVEAQFNRLEQVGIRTTYVDGHHHLQMHPLIFKILCKQASKRGIGWIRVMNESLSVVISLRSLSRGVMPFIERLVFGVLNAYNLKIARRYDMNVACRSLGLAWTGNIDEKCFLDLLDHTKGSVEEIFTHPDISTESGRQELEALTSGKVRSKLTSLGLEPIGYRELTREGMAFDTARGKI